MKMYTTSLIIREMKIKTTMNYYFTPIRTVIIKITENSKRWQEIETFVRCWWEQKM